MPAPVGTRAVISSFPPVGTPYRWHLDRNPQSIGAARREVRQKLQGQHLPTETIEVVELLTSEVVTNAIVHADSAPDIELAVSDGEVRVTVADDSGESPQLQPVDQTRLRGRGLRLVEQLAALWGTDRLSDGRKKVWFEVKVYR